MNKTNVITPRKRVESALEKKLIDKVPFTVYKSIFQSSVESPITPPRNGYLPQCEIERLLRNKGVCLVEFNYSGYKIYRPNVKIISKGRGGRMREIKLAIAKPIVEKAKEIIEESLNYK